jgi:hypothetical protein
MDLRSFTENCCLNALNVLLGVHPGNNTMSFVSGVGPESALVAARLYSKQKK